MNNAKHCLDLGAKHPYDAGADYWGDRTPTPPPAKDWAHAAARGVLAELNDRQGIKWKLEEVEHKVRAELTQNLAEIIRLAHTEGLSCGSHEDFSRTPSPPLHVPLATDSLSINIHDLAKTLGGTVVPAYDYGASPDRLIFKFKDVERLVEAVVTQVRDECAKVCEERSKAAYPQTTSGLGFTFSITWDAARSAERTCASTIRKLDFKLNPISYLNWYKTK